MGLVMILYLTHVNIAVLLHTILIFSLSLSLSLSQSLHSHRSLDDIVLRLRRLVLLSSQTLRAESVGWAWTRPSLPSCVRKWLDSRKKTRSCVVVSKATLLRHHLLYFVRQNKTHHDITMMSLLFQQPAETKMR